LACCITKAAHTHTHTITHTQTHSEYVQNVILIFHGNNIHPNAPECFFIRILSAIILISFIFIAITKNSIGSYRENLKQALLIYCNVFPQSLPLLFISHTQKIIITLQLIILISVCFCVCHNAQELPLTCMAISNIELLLLSGRMFRHKSRSKCHRIHDSRNMYKLTVSSSFQLLSVRRWQTIDSTTQHGCKRIPESRCSGSGYNMPYVNCATGSGRGKAT